MSGSPARAWQFHSFIGVNPLQTTWPKRGIVSGRVALLPRSAEIQPPFHRFSDWTSPKANHPTPFNIHCPCAARGRLVIAVPRRPPPKVPTSRRCAARPARAPVPPPPPARARRQNPFHLLRLADASRPQPAAAGLRRSPCRGACGAAPHRPGCLEAAH